MTTPMGGTGTRGLLSRAFVQPLLITIVDGSMFRVSLST